jgi:polyphosphate kinase 2 (PPK2 family)
VAHRPGKRKEGKSQGENEGFSPVRVPSSQRGSPLKKNALNYFKPMGLLNQLDLSKKVEEKNDYKEKLKQLQLDLLHYQRKLLGSKRNVVLVFEGPDAAGKGGVIKRLVEKLDPRSIRVYSIVKPTPEEFQHHYLWRFWTKIPKWGEMAIFDRSWYGRVLVERVESFATGEEWKRAYDEINNFERALVDGGTILQKYYLHISKDEQLRRFEARAADPYKRWKINEEDWRNREKWDEHNRAAEDMFAKTSTKYSEWNLIEANYKWFARIKALKLLTRALERELGGL